MRNLEENHKSTVCLHSLPVRGPPMDRFLSQSMKIPETANLTIFETKIFDFINFGNFLWRKM